MCLSVCARSPLVLCSEGLRALPRFGTTLPPAHGSGCAPPGPRALWQCTRQHTRPWVMPRYPPLYGAPKIAHLCIPVSPTSKAVLRYMKDPTSTVRDVPSHLAFLLESPSAGISTHPPSASTPCKPFPELLNVHVVLGNSSCASIFGTAGTLLYKADNFQGAWEAQSGEHHDS